MKIEKGVPVCDPRRWHKTKYPWGDMESGDSIHFKTDKTASIRTTAYRWIKTNKPTWHLVSRSTEDGIRLWFFNDDDYIKLGEWF